jgi:hypothetical protein
LEGDEPSVAAVEENPTPTVEETEAPGTEATLPETTVVEGK